MRYIGFVSAVLVTAALTGCRDEAKQPDTNTPPQTPTEPTQPVAPAADKEKAPLLEGLGNHGYPVTANEEAQPYFNQGLILSYAFNHAESERSFLSAAKLAPNCAMCFWGAALVLGPNINGAMNPDNIPKAWDSLQKALALADKVGEKERDLINALAKRYAEKPPEPRAPLDQAYAEAMREVAKKYPDDLEITTLFAEALMDLHPWDLWQRSGEPQPWTAEILATLESIIERAPEHPGANHFYIHAVEASPNPARGMASADRLNTLVPGAGHLVHMPGHIYLRVGRYADASAANERAIASDQAYITQCRSQGVYPLAYHPHNFHFLFVARTLEGRSQDALAAANSVKEKGGHHEFMRKDGWSTLQHYYVMPVYAMLRFGKWDDILAYPAPEEELVYPRAILHYGRGMAFRAQGKLEEAEKELAELQKLAADPRLEKVTIWDINPGTKVIGIAMEVLQGEIAAVRKDHRKALGHLKKAVEIEDTLLYDEPPDWYYPARHNLGAVLLEAGKAKDAEKVFLDELKNFPENGWSLFGLVQSLKAQKKTKDADEAQKRFDTAWANADITLTAARM
jgi:tetratricopeptide (TPR) repeat protein